MSTFMENLRQLFAECDTNNNGSLGRQEFNQLCSKIGLNQEAANETFDRLDSDRNDRITFEEFTAGFNLYTKQANDRESKEDSASTSTRLSSHQSSSSLNHQPMISSESNNRHQRTNSSSSNPVTTTPKSRSPTTASSFATRPVAARARKSASPLGVISLGSTGSSGLRTSCSTTGISSQNQESSASCDYANSVDNVADSSTRAESMIVYSSDAFNNSNDYADQATGSGQYGSLMSNSGCGSLNQMRNVQDLLDCVQKLQNENQILTQIFFKDKREREEYINQLGEEFDQQVREVEERAHRRAREELENEKRRLSEMMAAERETLQHHYKTIEKMSKLVKSSNGISGLLDESDCIDKVKSKLEDTYMENRQLKKSLLDTKTDVAMIWKEMEKLKKQYEDKLSNAYEKNNETRNECDHIKRQLNLMKDSNKKLQDASDVITNYITDKVEPVIKVATEGGDEFSGSHLSLNGIGRFADQSSSRRGSILSEYINGTNDQVSNSLDGYNGSVNYEAGPESVGSSGNQQQQQQVNNFQFISSARQNKLRHLGGESGEHELDRESVSTTSSSTGNYHLKVPKSSTKIPTRSKSEQKLKQLRENMIGSANDEIKSNKSISDEQTDNSDSRRAARVKSNEEQQHKSVAIRNLGRHFFIGNRTQSEAKLNDQQTKTESSIKQSISVDSSDEPTVEPADGPSKATFNIILVGDSFVGKSSFAARFMEGNFVQGLISNCSIDFKTKNYKVDGVNYTVNLWDTAGQERFRSITASYFRKADGIILMYDVTEKRSYLNVRNWMSTIADTASEDVAVLLVGNKIDLRQKGNQDKCVPVEEGYRLAKEYDIVFLEASVKTGINLVPSMGRLIRLIAKNNQSAEEDTDRIRLNDKNRTFNCMPKNC